MLSLGSVMSYGTVSSLLLIRLLCCARFDSIGNVQILLLTGATLALTKHTGGFGRDKIASSHPRTIFDSTHKHVRPRTRNGVIVNACFRTPNDGCSSDRPLCRLFTHFSNLPVMYGYSGLMACVWYAMVYHPPTLPRV